MSLQAILHYDIPGPSLNALGHTDVQMAWASRANAFKPGNLAQA